MTPARSTPVADTAAGPAWTKSAVSETPLPQAPSRLPLGLDGGSWTEHRWPTADTHCPQGRTCPSPAMVCCGSSLPTDTQESYMGCLTPGLETF